MNSKSCYVLYFSYLIKFEMSKATGAKSKNIFAKSELFLAVICWPDPFLLLLFRQTQNLENNIHGIFAVKFIIKKKIAKIR